METNTSNIGKSKIGNRYYGKCLNYDIKEVKTFHGIKNYTGTLFKLLDFGMVELANGSMAKLEVLRLKRNKWTVFVNGEDQGEYMKPDVLRTIFSKDKTLQIQATIRDADGIITNEENLKVYVPKREYDDPEYMRQQELKKEYWRTHEFEFIKQLAKLDTDIAYYKEIIKNDGTTVFQKYRISRIMKTFVNVDLSEVTIETESGNLMLPDTYQKTYKVKMDDLATWLWFDRELKADSFKNPNHEAFMKFIEESK